MSPGALLTQTLVTSGTRTNRIDRLAARALVERLPSPDDRRGVLVSLTDEGLHRVDAAMSSLLEVERRLLADLDEAERARLADLLRVVVLPFDA
jgi:DNA-binding MarR family transcriptional regulator